MPGHSFQLSESEAKKRVEVKSGPRGGMIIGFQYFRWFVTFVPIIASQGKTAEQILDFLYENSWNPRKKEGLEKRHDDLVIAINEAREE